MMVDLEEYLCLFVAVQIYKASDELKRLTVQFLKPLIPFLVKHSQEQDGKLVVVGGGKALLLTCANRGST